MDSVWLKNYPQGVPETINPDAYDSLATMFAKFAKEYGERPAFTNFGTSISYAELERRSTQLAAYFQTELQLQKGDRIALMMPNILQYPIAIFAALRAGLVVVNVNPLYTPRELTHQLNDSGATAIIVLENFANTVAKALPDIQIKHVIVTRMGDSIRGLKGAIMNFVVKHIKKMVPNYHLPEVKTWKSAMHSSSKLEFKPVALQSSDVAFLQYTGGTTGVAKGAVLTHRNMVANVVQCLAWVRSEMEIGQEVIVGALPLYHIFSLTVCCMCFMAMGSECLLITNPRDLTAFIKLLKQRAVTVFVGVNTLFNGLLNHSKFTDMDLSKLKLAIGGGMALQRPVSERWQKHTGMPLIEGYGLTETSPVVSINPITLHYFNGSSGLPVPSTEIQVRDDQGNAVDIGVEGELWVRGPQVMQGYWNKPEETKHAIDKEGWLSTGDMVRVDDNGFIYIVDRKKDMILVSGFNVYPNEVEEVLAAHPGIQEAAVIGVPCTQSGESIKAFVVRNDNELDKAEIIEFARNTLTAYKIPRHIEFVNELPKSNVGKVLRRELREAQA